MSKFLVIGDPHFKLDNAKATTQLHLVLAEHLKTNTYDAIIVLGDVMDRHESADIRPLTRLRDFLKMLGQHVKTYCLIGNHDRINNTEYLSEYHPLVGMEYMPNLTIVAEPIQLGEIAMVPYVPNGMFRQALATLPGYEQVSLIFAHQEINGAKLGSKVSEIAETWLDQDPLVISGHIHEYQEVSKNWIYVGTPFAHAFGDSNDKSLSVIIKNDTTWQHTRLYLDLPGKVLINIDAKDFMAKYLQTDWLPKNSQSYKFKITGSRVEIQHLKTQRRYPEFNTIVKLVFEYTDSSNKGIKDTTYRPYIDIVRQQLNALPLALQYFETLLQ